MGAENCKPYEIKTGKKINFSQPNEWFDGKLLLIRNMTSNESMIPEVTSEFYEAINVVFFIGCEIETKYYDPRENKEFNIPLKDMNPYHIDYKGEGPLYLQIAGIINKNQKIKELVIGELNRRIKGQEKLVSKIKDDFVIYKTDIERNGKISNETEEALEETFTRFSKPSYEEIKDDPKEVIYQFPNVINRINKTITKLQKSIDVLNGVK